MTVMEDKWNNLTEVLARITDLQGTSGPVDLTIGGVDPSGIVRHDWLLIRRAPSVVLCAVVNEFDCVSLTLDGVLVKGTGGSR